MKDEAKDTLPEKSDTSGFVDHLRLVHLTLCVFCLVAIIAVSSKESSSASRARQQTGTLLRIQSQWQDGRWLRDFAASREKSSGVIRFTSGQASDRYVLQPLNRHASRRNARFDWFALAAETKEAATALKPDKTDSLQNLTEAETIWDDLYLYRNAVELTGIRDGWSVTGAGDVSPIKPSQEKIVAVEKRENDGDRATDFAEVFLRADLLGYLKKDQDRAKRAAEQLVNSDNSRCYLLAREGSPIVKLPMYLLFRAECSSSPVDLQGLLTKGIEPLPPPGMFSSSFPDVAELAKNLKTLSLPELQTYFRAEEDRAGDKIEFPGIKIPAQSIAYWGSVIIIAIVAYWLSVFRDFAGRVTADDKAWATPWIGTSTEALSRVVFGLSVAFPPFTTLFLIIKGGDQGIPTSHRVCYALAAFVATSLLTWGIARCWLIVQRVRSDERSAPPMRTNEPA